MRYILGLVFFLTSNVVLSGESNEDADYKVGDQFFIYGTSLPQFIKGDVVVLKGNNSSPQQASYLDELKNYYLKHNKNIHYVDRFNQKLLPINESDVESFEMLNQFYARDNNHVYYQDQQIYKADPKTFKVLNRSSLYAKDKDHVFMGINYIANVDAATFKDVGFGYGVDKNWVYFEGVRLIDSDGQTFERIAGNETGFFKDRKNIYSQGHKLYQAHPETFEIIDGYWARDRDNLYYQMERVDYADPDSFRKIKGDKHQQIFVDKNNFYNEIFQWDYIGRNSEYKPPNIARFKEYLINKGSLKDLDFSTGKYTQIPLDTEGIALLGDYFYRTKNGLYYIGHGGSGEQVLRHSTEITDPDSFKETVGGYALDRKNFYYLHVASSYFYIDVIGSLDELEIDYESFKYEKPDGQLYIFADKYREFKFPVDGWGYL